jgi:hypothetical protein
MAIEYLVQHIEIRMPGNVISKESIEATTSSNAQKADANRNIFGDSASINLPNQLRVPKGVSSLQRVSARL